MNALTKRIIPCLDIKDGMTVKGVQFENLQELGEPVALAKYYADEGADELVLLDITATHERRKTTKDLVTDIARAINIPFTVGGGICDLSDVYELLQAGADKVSVNSAAFRRPELIRELATRFGSQCIVLAVDTKNMDGEWQVFLNGGRCATGVNTIDWVRRAVNLGAGELLVTSMNHDGTGSGFANDLMKMIADNVNVPTIASGGAGTMAHFADAFAIGKADAALAAGVFHRKEIGIPRLKKFLNTHKIPVR